jgi:aminocarboxymuconate-semialdehyde decarboxylase
VIDVHAHVIVRELLREAAPGEEWRPAIHRDERGQVVELNGRSLRSAVGEFVDVPVILDQLRCDRVVLSPWVPLLFEDVERCRLQNTALESLVSARVSALGSVPPGDGEELRRVMARGVLAGVEVLAHPELGRFEEFWAAAEETGAVVFIHPTTRATLSEYYLWNTVGNPLETTVAAAHMVMSGVLERHPNLRIILAHGGGALLALRGRLRHAHSFQPAARSVLQEDPVASIKRFWFDTITHDAEVLRELATVVGEDRLLLGSDHPFDMGDPDPLATVRAAGLHPEHLAENARRLFTPNTGRVQS